MSQQQKNKKRALIITSAGIIAAIAVGLYFVPLQSIVAIEPTTLPEDIEASRAIEIARAYVISSPTFSFDGISDSLDMISVNKLESYPIQYVIEFAFDSAQSGYGNRDGQMLAQVITPHTMSVIVSEGQVISAVTDKVWDEINHQYVLKKPSEKLVPDNNSVLNPAGPVTDYASFVSSIRAIGVSVEPQETLGDSPFSTPTRVISVGGATVQVFEFSNEPSAIAASKTVSKDGTEVGTSIIRWIDTPHFYTQGNIIVLYVGQNPEVLNLLDSLLGIQFAGM
jgi:hypothetical protein